MTLRRVQELPIKGKRVLVRVDFNVPLREGGVIADDTRLKATLPTLRYILEHGGSLVIMSHLGRPKGKRVESLSLSPVAVRLEQLLGVPVQMAQDCVGDAVTLAAKQLIPGDVLLLENLRFHPGEAHPDQEEGFVSKLAKLGDLYVNDAFGTAHRKAASTYTIAKYFTKRLGAGFLMQREVDALSAVALHPERPFLALIGGAKVSTKLGVLQSLVGKADDVLIGGGMAFTFLKAAGSPVGDSLVEEELVDDAKRLLDVAGDRLWLPDDVVIAQEIKEGATTKIVTAAEGIPAGWKGLDIGPKTLELWSAQIKRAHTLFWNGPMGVCEVKAFATGTSKLAHLLAKSPAATIAGGGDSIAAIQAEGLGDQFTHLSTGGGASLEFLERGTLPGIQALES